MKELLVSNPCDWYYYQPPNSTLLVYHTHFEIGTGIFSIQDALKPERWRTFYEAFSIVVVDPYSKQIVLIRDHFGCEPLYYFYDTKRLIFGSNLPAILSQLKNRPALNHQQIIDLFTLDQTYSDETFYHSICRVEPGHITELNESNRVRKTAFWNLDPQAADICYPRETLYLEHFSELLHDAVRLHAANVPGLAGELSGGLDSAAILVTAQRQGLEYPLFIHASEPGAKEFEDYALAECLIKHLQLPPFHSINADHFELIPVLQFCATLFAGSAPYLIFMLAHNVYEAVVKQGCKVLLSGAGGDECVSSHAPLYALLPHLIKQHEYRLAWHELKAEYRKQNRLSYSFVKRCERFLKFSHPLLFKLLGACESMGSGINAIFKAGDQDKFSMPKPYYPSVRLHEWDYLQGPKSHETRMRLEYSAVLGKAMGFEYRYPLLYPPLVEFCYRLPISQKRRDGVNRYLIRRYLAQYIPAKIYSKPYKFGGVFPATLAKCRRHLADDHFKVHFQNLPYMNLVKVQNIHHALIMTLFAYMFKYVADQGEF